MGKGVGGRRKEAIKAGIRCYTKLEAMIFKEISLKKSPNCPIWDNQNDYFVSKSLQSLARKNVLLPHKHSTFINMFIFI